VIFTKLGIECVCNVAKPLIFMQVGSRRKNDADFDTPLVGCNFPCAGTGTLLKSSGTGKAYFLF
jgi:hypothetical protein